MLIFWEDRALPSEIFWVQISAKPFMSCLSLGEPIYLSFPLWKMGVEIVLTLNRILVRINVFIHVGNLE